MPEKRKQQIGVEKEILGRKTVNNTLVRTFRIYPGDDELLNYIAKELATTKSEALRTAIRTQASLLAQIKKR